jgi:hypothetical protein
VGGGRSQNDHSGREVYGLYCCLLLSDIVGSNTVREMDLRLCVGRGLATDLVPAEGVVRNV